MNVTSTRDRILKSAFELISVKGDLGTSTREIAKQAKVAEVTLFRQFTSKEGLIALSTPFFFNNPGSGRTDDAPANDALQGSP
jgi:hypothetical protein